MVGSIPPQGTTFEGLAQLVESPVPKLECPRFDPEILHQICWGIKLCKRLESSPQHHYLTLCAIDRGIARPFLKSLLRSNLFPTILVAVAILLSLTAIALKVAILYKPALKPL